MALNHYLKSALASGTGARPSSERVATCAIESWVTGAPVRRYLQVIRGGTVVATVPSSASVMLTGQPRGMNVCYSVRGIAVDGVSMPSKEVFVALRSR